MTPKTILITGANRGLGLATARAAMLVGHRVIGTVRPQADQADFDQLISCGAHGRVLDLADGAAIGSVLRDVEDELGPIDVLIANAGYGHEGTFEESTMAELRQQFEVNVFGTVATIKAVLPGMRVRRRGHIIVITSVGGLVGLPGLSFYCGSKFALEGIAAALREEVLPFGVRVTAVEPGRFRTDFAGRSMARTARTLADYDDLMARRHAERVELGCPARAARVLMTLIGTPDPPRHLLLGSDAVRVVRDARAAFDQDIEAWSDLSGFTDSLEPAPGGGRGEP